MAWHLMYAKPQPYLDDLLKIDQDALCLMNINECSSICQELNWNVPA